MKIFKTSLAALAFLALVAGDKTFDPRGRDEDGSGSGHGSGKPKIKSAANFGNSGGKMELCPSGDCENGQVIRIKMSRLEEFEPATGKNKPKRVKQADNFNSADFSWSDLEAEDINDTPVLSTSYISQLGVGKDGMVDFNVTASIFEEDGAAMNGNQTVPVKAGSLKFTIAMANWPFDADTNFVRFGVTLHAKGKGKEGKEADMESIKKKAREGAEDIDRLDLGEGMFVDVPVIAVIDGVDTTINSMMEMNGDKMELVWDFPYFTDRVDYDPVLGSDDPSAQVESSASSSGSTGGSSATGSGSKVDETGSGSSTTPAPVTPAPVTPAPVTPAPVTPAPVTPAPETPAPTPSQTTPTTTVNNQSPNAAVRPHMTPSALAMTGLAALAYYLA